MTTAFTVRSVSPVPIRFDVYTGHSVRGIFYKLLGRANRDLASAIHSTNSLSPYTTSVLETARQDMLFHGIVGAGEPFKFSVRFSILLYEVLSGMKPVEEFVYVASREYFPWSRSPPGKGDPTFKSYQVSRWAAFLANHLTKVGGLFAVD